MAIKDLNELKPDKVKGKKLYADEWNTIVDALQKHVKNTEIHLPITINEEDNTLSYKEGNKIYTFTLNRKTEENWGEPYIDEIIVNNGEIHPEAIPSKLTDVTIEVVVKQEHNGQFETPSTFTLTYKDYDGNPHELNENQNISITIPQNTNKSVQDRSLNVTIVANEKTKEDVKITLTQVADEIDSYGRVVITGFSYNNLNYGTNSSVSPLSSLLCKLEIIWKSRNVTYTTSGLTKTYSSTISDSNVTVNQTNGIVTKTTANESDSEITIGDVLLTVTGQNSNYNTATATVKQSGTPMPDLIYGGISIGGNDGVFAYTVQTLPNLLSELLLDGNSFIKLDNNSTPKYLINTDIQNTINLLTLDDDMVVVYLLKDTTKNISVYDSTAEGYYLIPGTTDPIPYNPSFVISNGTYNYKGTTYKLIMIPTENKSLNYLIKIL